MKRYLSLVFLCIAFRLSAQVSITIGTGAGTYAHGDLREFQQNFASRYNVEAEVNSDFPPYMNYEGSFSFAYGPRFFSEIFFSYGSTGGRVSYSDYSGTIYSSQKVNYMAVTSSLGVRWWKDNYQFDVQFRLGRIFSRMELEQYQNVPGSSWTHSDKYSSEGGVLEPNFRVTRIKGNIGLYASAGASATIFASPFESDTMLTYVYTPQGDYAITPDWSGFRLSVGVMLILKKAKKDQGTAE
jgi:hypothetical protein